MNQLTQFNGTPVSILDHNGKKWLTAEEVGLCLGYAKDNASAGVRKMHERHTDEFTAEDACRVKLTRQGQQRELLVFSETGCIKLGFFSNTPKSKEFRHWAAQVLTGAAVKLTAVPDDHRLYEMESNVAKLIDVTAQMALKMGELVQVSHQQAQKLNVVGRYIGLLEINQKGKVKITRTVEAKVLALKAQGMANIDVARLLRVSPASVSLLVSGTYNFAPSEALKEPESVQEILEQMVADEAEKLVNKLDS